MAGPGPARSGAVAAGEGSIWAILGRGSLVRIDPNANKVKGAGGRFSTTAFAALIELSPAGTSGHPLALRDAGPSSPRSMATRSATARTELGSDLLHGQRG